MASSSTSATTQQRRGGIGFLGGLAILFIGLRLTHYIDWPWWVVLAPIWGPLAAGMMFALALVGTLGLYYVVMTVLVAVLRKLDLK